MSKIGRQVLLLQDQANELGFSTIEEAENYGYEVIDDGDGARLEATVEVAFRERRESLLYDMIIIEQQLKKTGEELPELVKNAVQHIKDNIKEM